MRAGAVVVDHALQDGSDDVAAGAAASCRALGLDPVEVVRVRVAPDGSGPEAAARTARYAALDEVADRLGAAAVLLGHTLDDQAEQVLLGLARGSGARSLSGMAAVRGRYRRPLLEVPRATVRSSLDDLGLRAHDDPTNADPATARARVRHRVLPVLEAELGPGVAAALARTAGQLREDADALDAAAAAVPVRDGGALPVADLVPLDPAVRQPGAAPGAGGGGLPRRCADPGARRRGRRPGRPGGGARGRSACRAVSRRAGRLGCCRSSGPPDPPPGPTQPDPRSDPDPEEHPPVDADDMGKDLSEVLISAERIDRRLTEMAAEVDRDYAGKDLLLVGVLKGAVMVMADFARALHSPVQMDWMAVSSYGSGTKSSGVVRILKDLDTDISGRHVLIVEDIIDSGLTLSWLIANLTSREPASVEVLTLLRKPDSAKVTVDTRYVGFDIPSEFVVGYGLDYAERYRNLPFVGTLAPHVYGG